MIEVVKEIGEYAISDQNIVEGEYIPLLAEAPELDMIILVDLISDSDGMSFNSIRLEDFRRYEKGKYLYKVSPSARAPDFSPTTKLTRRGKTFDFERTFRVRVLGWFDKYAFSQEQMLQIGDSLNADAGKIIEELNSLEIDSDKGYLMSIRVDGKYVGEIQEFRQIFLSNILGKYREFNNQEVYSLDSTCSLCGRSGEVFGNIAPFAWYSLDKDCYIAGGFKVENAWHNFCTCLDCTLKLEAGKTYILNHLDRTFAGVPFMLLPHLILDRSEGLGNILEVYEDFEKRKLSMGDGQSITADEDEIFEIATEFQDYVSFTMLFYRQEQARMRILLSVDDIYPSRFRALFAAKTELEEIPIFSENEVRYSFAALKRLVSPSKDSMKEFLDYMGKIFKGMPISYSRFMGLSASRFRQLFAEEKLYPNQVLSAFICFLYIQKLDLFSDRKEVGQMSESTLSIVGMDRLEDFFGQFPKAFDSSAKKGVFLLGVLTQNLLSIQYREKGGSTPFRKKLRGLKLRKEDVLALLPAAQNKLEEYDRNFYRQLESVISAYLLQAQENWDLSMDEISFYFTLGMNLNNASDSKGKLFRSERQENGEEEKEGENE